MPEVSPKKTRADRDFEFVDINDASAAKRAADQSLKRKLQKEEKDFQHVKHEEDFQHVEHPVIEDFEMVGKRTAYAKVLDRLSQEMPSESNLSFDSTVIVSKPQPTRAEVEPKIEMPDSAKSNDEFKEPKRRKPKDRDYVAISLGDDKSSQLTTEKVSGFSVFNRFDSICDTEESATILSQAQNRRSVK